MQPSSSVRRLGRVRQTVPLPRASPVSRIDVLAIAAVNAVVIVGMWVRHGGVSNIGDMATLLTAGGQLTALLGTYLALIGLLLVSRSPWLDQLYGTDRLIGWHRWVGFGCLWLLVAHTVLTTVGYAATARVDVVTEAWSLLTTYPYVLMATVGLVLLIAVAVASVRAARRSLAYETWYGIHLYGYLAVALAFAHELAVGSDFATDTLAQAYWVLLYVVVIACIAAFRVGRPIQLYLRHGFRVANLVQEAPGVTSVYVTGRDLGRLPMRAGQFFICRFLVGGGWWRPHPFSLSVSPNGQYLRFTIKESGDDTRRVPALHIGTRVFLEGPYGSFTGARRTHPRVLLVAGGIGVTPLRALLEELSGPRNAVVMVYRARSWEDVVFRDELDALARARHVTVHYLIGRRRPDRSGDALAPQSLARLVPDLRERDVYICGPESLIHHVQRSLRFLHIPRSQVHAERFAF
jgi:predicted ferric reductase